MDDVGDIAEYQAPRAAGGRPPRRSLRPAFPWFMACLASFQEPWRPTSFRRIVAHRIGFRISMISHAPLDGGLPEDGLQDAPGRGRRRNIVGDPLHLHLRSGEARVLAPHVHRDSVAFPPVPGVHPIRSSGFRAVSRIDGEAEHIVVQGRVLLDVEPIVNLVDRTRLLKRKEMPAADADHGSLQASEDAPPSPAVLQVPERRFHPGIPVRPRPAHDDADAVPVVDEAEP